MDIQQQVSQESKYQGTFCLKAFAGLLFILLLGYYFPFIFLGRQFYFSDLTYYFEPFMRFFRQCLAEGHLPLWNPYMYCGMAQAAVPSPGLCYLPNYLMMFLPFGQGLAFYMVLHQMLAGVGAYLLISSLGWGIYPAIIAGLACALNGYMFTGISNFSLSATASWLPLLLYCCRQLSPQLTARNMILCGGIMFCSGGSIASGRPEIFVPSLVIGGIFSVWLLLSEQKTQLQPGMALRTFILRLFGFGLGLMLAAPVVFPALEWASVSPRAQGMAIKYVLLWSANWYDWLSLICAQAVGDLYVLGNRFLPAVAARSGSIPYIASAFVGPFIGTLAVWGLLGRRWQAGWVVGGVLIVLASLSAGSNSSLVAQILEVSPWLKIFRYPVKLFILIDFCLALAAARGAYLSLRQEIKEAALWITSIFWMILLTGAVVGLFIPQVYMSLARSSTLFANQVSVSVIHELIMRLSWTALVSSLSGLILIAYYKYFCRADINKAAYGATVDGAVLLSLLIAAWLPPPLSTTSQFFEKESLTANWLYELRRRDEKIKAPAWNTRYLNMYFDPLAVPVWYKSQLHLPYQQAFFQYARTVMLPNINLDFSLANSFGYEAAETAEYKELHDNAVAVSAIPRRGRNKKPDDRPLARFCAISATRYVFTHDFLQPHQPVPLPYLDSYYFRLLRRDSRANLRLYQCLSFRERIRFVETPVPVSNWKELRGVFAHQDFLAPLSVDFVDTEAFLAVKHAPEAAISKNDQARLLADNGEHLEIFCHVQSPRILVVADHIYPGWVCLLDGRPTKIHNANWSMRAVVVPAGTHKITMDYRPTSVIIGLVCSLLAFIIWASITLACLFAQRGVHGGASRLIYLPPQ